MKTKLAKAVRAQFALEMSKRLPGFQINTRSQQDVYALKISPNLVCFICLSISDRKDSFVLEVAANETDQFPWTEMPGTARDVTLAGNKKVWRFRISKLWGELKPHEWALGEVQNRHRILERARDKTYLAPEKLEGKLGQIEPKVREAVDKVCEYGIPYFEVSAKKTGF